VLDAADQGKLIGAAREKRQMFGHLHPRHARLNGGEVAPDFARGLRLRIETVDMAWAPKLEKENDASSLRSRGQTLGLSFGPQKFGQGQSSESKTADLQESAPA
jgi:hypothetical protein